jgi:hypothetical protein
MACLQVNSYFAWTALPLWQRQYDSLKLGEVRDVSRKQTYITCRPIGKFFMLIVATLPSTLILYLSKIPSWRDFGSALPFQTRLTQTKPVLSLSKKHGLQVQDQGRQHCCHNKHKKRARLTTPNTTYKQNVLCCRITTSPHMNTRILIQ